MNKLIYILPTILLTACTPEEPSPVYDTSGRGLYRAFINKMCLEEAAEINKATQQTYNDLDEVVAECGSQSYYQANTFCEKGCSKTEVSEAIVVLKGE